MSDETKSSSTTTNAGPTTTHSVVPTWTFMLTLVLVFLGAVYFDHHGGWFSPDIYAPYKSADELEMYQPKSGAAALLEQGKQIYERN